MSIILTMEQASNLKHGTILHLNATRNKQGECQRWKVNGNVKTWKTDPSRIEIPLKHGLKYFHTLDEHTLNLFHLESVCPLIQERRLTSQEMVDLELNSNDLAIHYGLHKRPWTFDAAIPQPLFDQLGTDSFDPWSQFVYCYNGRTGVFGELFPLTMEAVDRMKEIWPDIGVPPVFGKSTNPLRVTCPHCLKTEWATNWDAMSKIHFTTEGVDDPIHSIEHCIDDPIHSIEHCINEKIMDCVRFICPICHTVFEDGTTLIIK